MLQGSVSVFMLAVPPLHDSLDKLALVMSAIGVLATLLNIDS